MALYGGLAENTRRNERVERGTLTVVAGSPSIAYVTIDPRVNASITAFIKPTQMRFMTSFQLAEDDGGAALATTGFSTSGSINATSLTINSIVYAPGTVLTIRSYTAAGATATTNLAVRWQIWGNLGGSSQNF